MRKEEAERKEQGNKNATSRCMVRDSCERKGRGSLLFSPSLLGGTIVIKRDQTQPWPRQAWLFAIFPGLTHACCVKSASVQREKMGSRLSDPRYCIGKKFEY